MSSNGVLSQPPSHMDYQAMVLSFGLPQAESVLTQVEGR
jgi:hypothetical protein